MRWLGACVCGLLAATCAADPPPGMPHVDSDSTSPVDASRVADVLTSDAPAGDVSVSDAHRVLDATLSDGFAADAVLRDAAPEIQMPANCSDAVAAGTQFGCTFVAAPAGRWFPLADEFTVDVFVVATLNG